MGELWRTRLESMRADLRYSVRAFVRSPGFFALAAIGTALGVAAITCVSSVAEATLVQAMPYRDPGRLVVVWDQLLKLNFPRFPISIANYADYRAENHVFEDIAAFEPRAVTVVTRDRAERTPAMTASANLLGVLGDSMAEGRWFDSGENHGVAEVAVLSYDFARRHTEYGPGAKIRIDGVPRTIVGVLAKDFQFRISGEPPEIWEPANLDPRPRDIGNLRAIARLKPGVTPATAQAAMHVIAAGLKQRYHAGMGPHGEDGGYDVLVTPLGEELFAAARPTLYAIAVASGILLLLGLANMALLWMGRAAARTREAAVRLALGAPRARVAQQLVIEALVPSIAGGALALGLTLIALPALNAAHLSELAVAGPITVDLRVFVLAMLLAAAAGVLFGVLPVRSLLRHVMELRISRSEPRDRVRPLLVVVQVALACALLAPSLLLVESFSALERVSPGFRTQNLLTGYVTAPESGYATPAQVGAFYQRVESTLTGWRGAGEATMASRLPMSFGSGGDPFSIEGRGWGASGTLPQFAHEIRVGESYFSLMGIPVMAGRAFDGRDFAGAGNVAVVNETLARAFWPNESPIGKRILMGAPRAGAPWMEIVGIVGSVHSADLTVAPAPQIYRPYVAAPSRTMALIVAGPAGGSDLARLVRTIDPQVPVYQVRTIAQHVSETLERPRFRTELFSAYGLLAFTLAAFGIYSISVYSAVRRRREFAVRAALGATGGRLLMASIGGTLRPAAVGAVFGLAGGYAVGRMLKSVLYSASISDAGVYLLAAALVLGVVFLAGWTGAGPLRRVAPAEVLRYE